MYTSELKTGSVKKIVVDPTSGDVTLITPIFPLGKVTNHKEEFKKWGVAKVVEKVYGNLKRAVGKADLTLMKTLDNHFAHPTNPDDTPWKNYTYQSQYSLGKLAHVYPEPDSDLVMWGAYDIKDPIAKRVILEYQDSYNKGLVPLYTSSQIVNSASENPYSIENFDLMHTTLTDEPSFGKELTKVGAVCQGAVQQCTMQIKSASNTAAETVSVTILDNTVQVNHQSCPFCVESELRSLFNKNSLLKINRASNLQMSPEQTQENKEETPKETPKMVMPDADQEKNNSSVIDTEKLAKEISQKVEENFKKNEVKEEPKEEPKEDKKPEMIKVEGIKEYNVKEDPEYKKMAARLEKMEKALEKNQIDRTELDTLKSEQNFNKIGSLLANYESNFVNPETSQPDAKAFDKAFEFFRNTKWSLEDIDTMLKIISPYGTSQRKYVKEDQPMSVIQKAASQNHGVPKFDSAFGTEEKVNSASNVKSKSGLSLVDSILAENTI